MMSNNEDLDANKSPRSPFNDELRFQEINLSDEELTPPSPSLQLPQHSSRSGSILRKNNSTKKRNAGARIVFSDHNQTINEFGKSGSAQELTRSSSSDSFQQTPKLQTHAHFEDNEDTFVSENKTLPRKGSVMKRHRWGTKRDKKGAPTVGRAKTLRWRNRFDKPHHDGERPNDSEDEADAAKNRASELRTLYFNMPLPQEAQNENGEPAVSYPRNKIRTTKYTPLSFLPKNISFQFRNIANIYFLIMIVMGFFNIFGVPNPGLSVVPLAVIVLITALKDAIEDSRRLKLDMEVNNTPTHILQGVENYNVSDDNISNWRKFKKLNTRMVLKTFAWCSRTFTKEGKEKARLAQIAKDSMNARTSMENYADDFRKSFQMDDLNPRASLDDPFGDSHRALSQDESIIDASIPHNPATPAKFVKDYWKSVKVGDIVRIHNNDEIPADILLLATSDPDGACYVETKNLDGETNLKVRQSLKAGTAIRNARHVQRSRFWVESEGPHANLYSYQGNMKWYGEDSQVKNEPVTINNLLLRGFSLRNTKWALGVVIFTGPDTKIMLNSGDTVTKRSRISRELNYTVLLNFFLLFIICFVSGLVNGISYRQTRNSRDFFEFGTIAGSPAANGIVSFFVAVILYQSLVPISLYISIEIIKTAQAFFIYSDVNMYYPKLDYPCTPKSWNISDDLGQIEYIFSDKTGTLTQNVMEFKKCTINGVSYGRAYTEALAGLRKRQGVDVEEEAFREKKGIAEDKEVMIQDLYSISQNSNLRPEDVTFVSKEFVKDLKGEKGEAQKAANEHFMLSLAICHSVLAETDKETGKTLLKAQSPDEAALVGTARDLGFAYVDKTKKGVIVDVQGVQKEFQVLNVLEFNSTRKRMSAIIKLPPAVEGGEPKALLICKGADSIIYSRLTSNADETLLEKTALHLEEFATEGLRTLCIAQRELSWSEYTAWSQKHDIAAAALVNREEKMEEVADSIERELELLGGTAIEDRLQDGVPDAIAVLAQAGIKLWVLTGDKVETAINIGFSCNLLGNDMELLVLKTSGEDVKNISDDPKAVVGYLLDKYLKEKFQMQGTWEEVEQAKKEHGPPHGDYGVVIDGDALKVALQGDNMRKFLLLCKQCKAVLCCRVSPAQKAAVVKMVKDTLDVMTLAIGDGSNDVAMIQSADIGVGIAGEEGRQAVMSSDYAFGQFRFLARLILVHGRWSYKRLSEMIPSFFYKNVIFTLALFWYGISNQFDGTYLFEYTYLTFYNLAYTSLPVIFMGILDKDVEDVVSLLTPQLYTVGIYRSGWTMKKFWWYMADGLYQSLVSFFVPYLLYYKTGLVTYNGLNLDHRYWIGTLVASIASIACNLYMALHLNTWDWLSMLIILLSIILIFAWTGIWSSTLTSEEYYKAAAQCYGTTSFWACLIVGIAICLLPRFIYDVVTKLYYPNDSDIVRECVALGQFDQYPDNYDPTDPNRVKISKYSIEKTLESQSQSSSSASYNRTSSVFGSRSKRNSSYPINNQDVTTEEIRVSSINRSSRDPDQDEDGEFKTLDYAPRTSLDRTRHSMLREGQLDMRRSVENARTSLDLPGLTKAETLLSGQSRDRI